MARRWVLMTGLAAGVLGLGVVATQFTRAAAARESLQAQEALSTQLDADRLTCLDRSEYQRQLVGELILGRVTLSEAADSLAEANESRPGWERGLDLNLSHLPDRRTRTAQVLVASVVAETAADPGRGGEAVGRVTAEFEQLADAADD